jgi:Tripartite tricarboxylate transporter TctB family
MSTPKRNVIDRAWLRDHSELGVCALLLLTGLLVLVDSLLGTNAGSSSDPLGPHAVPFVLGVLLLVLAVLLAVDVLRGGHGEAEAGEDIDLAAPADKRTVGMLAGVLIGAVDLVVLLVIGGIGFLMRRYGLPVLPAIIGVILGPDAELQLRRALQIADGDWTTLVSTPMSVIVYLIIAALLLVPAIRGLRKRSRNEPPTPDRTEQAGAR